MGEKLSVAETAVRAVGALSCASCLGKTYCKHKRAIHAALNAMQQCAQCLGLGGACSGCDGSGYATELSIKITDEVLNDAAQRISAIVCKYVHDYKPGDGTAVDHAVAALQELQARVSITSLLTPDERATVEAVRTRFAAILAIIPEDSKQNLDDPSIFASAAPLLLKVLDRIAPPSKLLDMSDKETS